MYEQVAEKYLLDDDVAAFMDAVEPVGGAQHRRAAARGGRARDVGEPGRRDARPASARATSRSRASSRAPASDVARALSAVGDRRPGGPRRGAARQRRAAGRRRRARPRRARDGEVDGGPRAGAAARRPSRAALVELAARRDARPPRRDARRCRRRPLRRRAPFEAGLLARAHRGILYVDEVNLLPDHLVDALLDAAASGGRRVERDGVCVVHDARFLLVGTMNVEEGELRPQLLDRFGLGVEVTGARDAATRARDRAPPAGLRRRPGGLRRGVGGRRARRWPRGSPPPGRSSPP